MCSGEVLMESDAEKPVEEKHRQIMKRIQNLTYAMGENINRP